MSKRKAESQPMTTHDKAKAILEESSAKSLDDIKTVEDGMAIMMRAHRKTWEIAARQRQELCEKKKALGQKPTDYELWMPIVNLNDPLTCACLFGSFSSSLHFFHNHTIEEMAKLDASK